MHNDTISNLDQQALYDEDMKDSSRTEMDKCNEDIRRSEEQAKLLEEEYLAGELPSGFFFEGDRLMYAEVNKEEKDPKSPIFVASRLYVVAITRDLEGNNHGRLLQFKDLDGVEKCWAMPMALLARDGAEYRAELLSMGLQIGTHKYAKSLLAMYIQMYEPIERALCVENTGWYKNCFLLPDRTFGHSRERIILQKECTSLNPYSTRGSLCEWRENVSLFCRGNSRLLFATSLGFAPPFLNLMEMESGGVNLTGPSSIGKTTVLRMAASIWGGPDFIKTWRTTVNGLEGVASIHNDSLLCLDEIAQCDPARIGEAVYLLGNGVGKGRANQLGRSRKRLTWRLIFLSTGELGLEQLMREADKKTRAGQEVRLIEIPAQTGQYGLFESLHGFSGGKDLSEALEKRCQNYYGLAGRELLTHLTNETEVWKNLAKDISQKFVRDFLPKGANGQVGRVLNRFALIAAAGEIASLMGITGWERGEASAGVLRCFHDWLDYRGGIESHEEKMILNQVRLHFIKYGESRYTRWDTWKEEKTVDRAGFRKHEYGETEYLVFVEVFRNEICEGYSPQQVIKVMIKHGLLKIGKDGKSTRSERFPGTSKNTRCYRVTSKVLGEVDEDDQLWEESENEDEGIDSSMETEFIF